MSKGKASGTALIEGAITDGYLPPSSDASNPWIQLFMKIHAQYDASAPFDGNVEYGMANACTPGAGAQGGGQEPDPPGPHHAIKKNGASWKGPGRSVPRLDDPARRLRRAQMAQMKGGKIVTIGSPLITDPSATGAITPYAATQLPPPANGVPGS